MCIMIIRDFFVCLLAKYKVDISRIRDIHTLVTNYK